MDNIAIILFNDSRGGAEQYLKMVAKYNVEKQNQVHTYFLTKKNTKAWEDLEQFSNFYCNYSSSASRVLGFFWVLFKCTNFKTLGIQTIYTSHVHINAMVGFFRKIGLLHIKFQVARESTSVFWRFKGVKLLFFKTLYKLGYSKIELLICQTEFMKNSLLKNLPWLEKSTLVKVIPNPINAAEMRMASNLGSTSQMDEGMDYIVSAGRLIDEKGFDLLINAFANLKEKHPRLNLLILGEGKLRNYLENQIEHLECDNRVFLPGFVDNVFPYFKKAKLCIVSSRVEGFPNVLLQMMSQNTNVISTKCAGGIDNIDGVVTFEANNQQQLNQAIAENIYRSTKNNREKFSNELKEREISNFIKIVKGYLQITSKLRNI